MFRFVYVNKNIAYLRELYIVSNKSAHRLEKLVAKVGAWRRENYTKNNIGIQLRLYFEYVDLLVKQFFHKIKFSSNISKR